MSARLKKHRRKSAWLLVLLLSAMVGAFLLRPKGSKPAPGSAEQLRKLQESYPELIGWLTIPELGLSEAVLLHEGEEDFYLHHDMKGEPHENGSLFLESCSSADMSDRVTVIYGHNAKNGELFGRLQEWAERRSNLEGSGFFILTGEGRREYRLVAFLPYSDAHLLYNHDFTRYSALRHFWEDEVSHCIDSAARYDENLRLSESDRIVILSTCLDGDDTRRFLVIGLCKNQK